MALPQLPDGWTVWNEEPAGRVILAYRPDVFDTQSFPAACLPTLVVAPGASPDLPPERRVRSEQWYVALYLEPTVRDRERDTTADSRDEAIARAVEVAAAFVDGEVAYRELYREPRDGYLDELDSLLGGTPRERRD